MHADNMISVLLNGQKQELPEELNIQQALEHLSIDIGRVAVEINGRIVRKKEWTEHRLKDGDVIEVVNFVGGGSRH